MALFSKKNEEEKNEAGEEVATETKKAPKKAAKETKVETPKAKEEKGEKVSAGEDISWVLVRPRVTEKAAILGEANVYTFEIAPRANKILVKKAIKSLYNVVPEKVNISAITKKATFTRGHRGTKGGGKKAMVFLKKGDKIEF
jgi:large subunit ribosomal protein L23